MAEPVGWLLAVLGLALLLVLAGLVFGLVMVLRPTLMSAPYLQPDAARPRLTADVRMGEEQIVLHLGTRLGISADRDQAVYGELYVVSSSPHLLRLASRSEIARGFVGEVRLRREDEYTHVEYFLLALPGDEELYNRVLRLERAIADALRSIDSQAQIGLPAGRARPLPAPRGLPPRA